jgi:hypothetical protein
LVRGLILWKSFLFWRGWFFGLGFFFIFFHLGWFFLEESRAQGVGLFFLGGIGKVDSW